MFKFNFGDEVENIINGFRGIIVVRQHHFNGCIRYFVEPTINKKEPHKVPDMVSFDEQELKLLKAGKVKPKLIAPAGPGPG